ncbi:DedA family protein [Accumulibacter sp.]|uniref:DedA family protein n=1 Tax=Accumulibacter sp. TaxID=2053492 RepID=UPI0028C4E3BB|nr:DedA family protein [Accumulibacter sp.]
MISAFVASYGYLAVFVGTLLEGESILIAAGFAAHRGLLDWHLVALVAMLGATLGDQLAFLLGRWKGPALTARFPSLARQKPRIDDLLQRHHVIFILGVRFLYGLRIAGPVLLGSSGIPLLRFALLNAIGAALWAATITGAGYSVGVAISALIADLKTIEEVVLVVIVVAGLAFWLWRRLRTRASPTATERAMH